jgi:hypothetical protein
LILARKGNAFSFVLKTRCDNGSLGAFYGPEVGQKRGREGTCLTVMLDLQYISFGVVGDRGAETAEGRGGDEAFISQEEGRGCDPEEGRQVGNTALTIRMRWHAERWEMTQLGRVD